jgi:hypothetical protein
MRKITLKTLPKATAQQVFNQVANHLLTQNKQSTSSIKCSYRGNGGLMCAAGCLIDEKEYNKAMEDVSWCGLVLNGTAPVQHVELINKLQSVHDSNIPAYWPAKLKEVAMHYELDFTQVKGLA